MKYIRTKDGIYKATEINGMIVARGGVAYSCDIANVHYPIVFKEKDIIKQADTIEELCDCFIAVDKNGNLCEDPMIAKWHCFKSFCNYYKVNKIDVDCYLAILTDKGLIFVAKMNDKGELELL